MRVPKIEGYDYVGMRRVGPGGASWHVFREKGAYNELRISDEKLRELAG